MTQYKFVTCRMFWNLVYSWSWCQWLWNVVHPWKSRQELQGCESILGRQALRATDEQIRCILCDAFEKHTNTSCDDVIERIVQIKCRNSIDEIVQELIDIWEN